ncbi:MAG TPA: hypothetical protein VGQ60_03415 [Nitrospiraceae bacterium]|nr:hypothetical protein [Nitrospiraceae bacterium]
MNSLVIMLLWFSHHPLFSASFFFGGTALAVVLYTYVHDYKMLEKKEWEEEWKAPLVKV